MATRVDEAPAPPEAEVGVDSETGRGVRELRERILAALAEGG